MDVTAQLQILPEDLSRHDANCLYRLYIEDDRESSFQSPATMEKELRENYTAEAVSSRHVSKKRKKGGRGAASAKPTPLTPDEQAWVNAKVEGALTPDGPIQWYLKSQREEFQKATEHVRQLCKCSKDKMSMDTNTDQPGPSNTRAINVEVVAIKTEPVMTGAEDAEMKEDEALFSN